MLIVGAGPVGLMLACELSLAGVRPVVLEKRAEPSELPRANGLGGQIVDVLDHRGLLERFSEGELLGEVFAFEEPARHVAGLLQDSGVVYGAAEPSVVGAGGAPQPSEAGAGGLPKPSPAGAGGVPGHPLVGRFVPDLALAGGGRVAELMRAARPVLLDLGGGVHLDDDWIDVVRARCDAPPADALLIRPDGYVAWAGTEGLAEAAERWFGPSLTASPA
uniref:Putative monooxygenase n=1 Tax=Nonomuraea gerenzanensis TaxID=93944 RepID=A0A1M4E170_9ACTN|nr:putative monooxygenase [Nonomuraea gerenzanensis]